MRSGPVTCALVGLALLACGRTDSATSSSKATDAGELPDTTSAQTMPSLRDASPTIDPEPQGADDIADAGGAALDGAYGSPGSTCTVPSLARSTTTCQVTPYPNDVPPHCGRATEYELLCSEVLDGSALGCNLIAIEGAPMRAYDYCCPCEGTDAATGCVYVDPATYDRSCTRDSDCMFIWSGTTCAGGCTLACGLANAAINVDGKARYEQALVPVQADSLETVCHCPNESSGAPGPVCVKGVCAVPNNQ